MTLGLFFGVAAGVVNIVAYIIYNYFSKNRPNIAAWSLWAFLTLLNTSSYFVMSSDWVKSILTIVNSFLCILTLVLALYRGKFDKLDIWDKLAFIVGVVAGLVWIGFKSATYANLVLQVSIFLGFIPVYRGVWKKPDCEKALPWLVWCIAYCFNAVTVALRWQGQWQDFAYPVTAFVYHLVVALLVILRTRNPNRVDFSNPEKKKEYQCAIK
jgi:hypothetical protein